MVEQSSDTRPSAQGRSSGEAFFVAPEGGEKCPGVLLLHSWWGLTAWTKDLATRIADEGYMVLAPDLLQGARPKTSEEGERILSELSPDELSSLVLASARIVQNASAGDGQPIAVVGFSMGASMAFWLSARLPDVIGAVVTFYGAQSIDFDEATASFQGHFADDDHLVSEEDRVVTEAFIRLGENETEFHLYPGTNHWFFEPGDTFDADAADLAWERMLDFIGKTIGTSGSEDDPDEEP
jgi:carboxymethylenebutenolidase